MSSSVQRVSFIGLGNMGFHMASNLLKRGIQVSGFDVNRNTLDLFEKQGGKVLEDVRQGVDDAQVIVSMLPSNQHVLSTYLDPSKGLLSHAKFPRSSPVLLIDSSTVNPSVSKQVAAALSQVNPTAQFVDAPVSGGVNGAKNGTLTFMVGASSPTQFETQVKPFLGFMGKNIVHCGDVGTGQVAKLCNNMILASSMVAVCEAMNMGQKLGMDSKVLAGILNTSTARCWSSDSYNPVPGVMPNVPSSNNYDGGFGSQLMLKDLGLALEAALEVKAPIPLASASQSLYQILCQNPSLAGKDFSVMLKFLQNGGNGDKQ
ncbi:3-hydroxyisobutyrate dehydrogenase [Batrachochytrium salamandrivorans]|nr:3-hydroxyisobutyrate dehydrogenase [Batrachochytrium salamandrivorans]